MAAGDSLVRVPILAPRERVMWRLTRMLLTVAERAVVEARLTIACLALKRCE